MNNIREKKCFSSKIAYKNEKKAKQALHQQQDWGARVCRVYKCQRCGKWHLTSSSYRHSDKKHPWKSKNRYKRGEEINGYRGGSSYVKDWLFNT